jgi:hypothetical protein
MSSSTNSNKPKQNKTIGQGDHGPQIAALAKTVQKLESKSVAADLNLNRLKDRILDTPRGPLAGVRKLAKEYQGPKEGKLKQEIRKEAEVLEHGSIHKSGLRHGRIVRNGIVQTKFGSAMEYCGTERLGELSITGLTPAGTIIDQRRLNPKAIGVALPRVAALYDKWMAREIVLEHIPETSQVNENAFGSVYEGLQCDPDDEAPSGNTGIDAMATWNSNGKATVMINTIKDVNRHKINVPLALQAQSPLFVESTDEARFDSQGVLYAVSGTDLGEAATTVAIGEWFMHYKIHFFEMNPSQGDVEIGTLSAFSTGLPSLNTELSSYIQFTGPVDLITAHSHAVTGVSFSVPSQGTYLFQFFEYANSGGALCTTNPTVAPVTQSGVEPSLILSGNMMAASIGNLNSALRDAGNTISAMTGQDGVVDTANVASGTAISQTIYTSPAGAAFEIVGTTYNAGTGTGTFRVSKLDSTYHKDQTFPSRTTANLVNASTGKPYYFARQEYLKWRTERNVAAYDELNTLPPIEELKMIQYINDNYDTLDPDNLSVLIETLDLPIRKPRVRSAVLPILITVARWALVTFGPILAEKAIDFVSKKLQEKAGGKKKKHKDEEFVQLTK